MEKVRFVHPIVYGKMVEKENKDGTVTIGIRKGRATVCVIVEEDGTRSFGASFCSPKDSFNRVKGRMVAEARARMRGHRMGGFDGESVDKRPEEQGIDFLNTLMDLGHAPQWAKEVVNPFVKFNDEKLPDDSVSPPDAQDD